MKRQDNYQIQIAQAKRLFLTYDQEELIRRCLLDFDDTYFYTSMLSEPYRIHRQTGHMERLLEGSWVDGNSFGEVMTMLDWLCDSKPERYITGRWINVVTHGHYFHGNLQEDIHKSYAKLFDEELDAFAAACRNLGGQAFPGADVGYTIELVDGLRIALQLWHSDEEFPPRLRCLWDENTIRYIRYETTWFATGLLMDRIKEKMKH